MSKNAHSGRNPQRGHNYYIYRNKQHICIAEHSMPFCWSFVAITSKFIIVHRILRIQNHKLWIDLDATCRNWLCKSKSAWPQTLLHTHTHMLVRKHTHKTSFIPHDCQNCILVSWVEYVIALIFCWLVCLLVCLRICCWFSVEYFFFLFSLLLSLPSCFGLFSLVTNFQYVGCFLSYLT